MCATWILRVEAEQRACKQAEMCQPGAEDAETVGLDKEGARRSAERHKHAIRHNEITVGRHREREEALCATISPRGQKQPRLSTNGRPVILISRNLGRSQRVASNQCGG